MRINAPRFNRQAKENIGQEGDCRICTEPGKKGLETLTHSLPSIIIATLFDDIGPVTSTI
jgi:hypothetical protein